MPLRHQIASILLAGSISTVAAENDQSYTPEYLKELQERAEFVARFAGDPIYSVHLRAYSGFEPLGTTSLVIYEKREHGYLVTVSPCWDLPSTPYIGGITSYMNILAKFNAISTANVKKCMIKEMRRINVKAMNAAEKAINSGEKAINAG